jgi:uncharacterized protein (TIGR02145 family)
VCWSTASGPTIADSKTVDGAGIGSFTSVIKGLTPGTTYYVRAYATNSEGTAYGEEQSFSTNSYDYTVTDIDGNTYQAVQIGQQIWMAENLKVTRYADGTSIPLVEDAATWGAFSSSDKAYCWHDNSVSARDVYGGLYTWAAAMNGASSSSNNPSGVQGVCPNGWHLPSDAEWKQLEMYLGMSQADADNTGFRGVDEGGKLKEAGTVHWDSPNTGATNESGFTALPGSDRVQDGGFGRTGIYAHFWTATETGGDNARSRYLDYLSAGVARGENIKREGYSIRCVRD